MSQTARYILFIAISFLIIFGWTAIQQKLYPPKPGDEATAQNPAATGATGQAPTVAAPSTPTPAPAPAPSAPQIEAEEAPGLSVSVDTSLWTAEFSPRGGTLTSFVLKGRKEEARARPGAPHEGMNLATPGPGQPLPLATEIGNGPGFGVDATYKVVAKTGNAITFQRTHGGMTVRKTLSWQPDSYVLKLAVDVSGAPAGPLPVKAYYTTYQEQVAHHMLSFAPRPEIHQAACYIGGERSVVRRAPDNSKPPETPEGTPAFAGIDEKYFLAAMSPGSDPAPSSCILGAPVETAAGASGNAQAVLQRTVTVATGGAAATGYDLFLGPKETEPLEAAGHDLSKSVDLGFFGIIGKYAILPVLKIFQKFVSNWGVAIILLTVLVKLLTLPLTHHQMKSAQEGQRLAPEVEKIKKKFAGDNQRVQVETMKMYKEHGYQPLAGCVPMLVQIPIWWALYATLGASFEIYNEPFIKGWINDLTATDPYYITPILMTVTMMLTQILTPQPTAQQQPEMKYMMWAMPLMFGLFMLSYPSGLVLYIFTNNLLSIGQSIWFRRKYPIIRPPATA